MEVTLTKYECDLAANVGKNRVIESMHHGGRDTIGKECVDTFTDSIVGAAGEMAAAKALNLYWSGSVNTFKCGGDVGDIQIRTRTKEHYDLIVRDKCRSSDSFVLVVGKMPRYRIVGWIAGMDAKQDRYRQDHGNYGAAYFVPQGDLLPIHALIERVAREKIEQSQAQLALGSVRSESQQEDDLL